MSNSEALSPIRRWTGQILREWPGALVGLIVGLVVLAMIDAVRQGELVESPGISRANAGAAEPMYWGTRWKVDKNGRLVSGEMGSYIGGQEGLELQVARLVQSGNSDAAFRVVEAITGESQRRKLLLVLIDRLRSDHIRRGLSPEQIQRIRSRPSEWNDFPSAPTAPAAPLGPAAPTIPRDNEIRLSKETVEQLVRERVAEELQTQKEGNAEQEKQDADEKASEKSWLLSVGKDLERAEGIARALSSPSGRGEALLAVASEGEAIGRTDTRNLEDALAALHLGGPDHWIGERIWSAFNFCFLGFATLAGMVITTVVKNYVGDFGSRPKREANGKRERPAG